MQGNRSELFKCEYIALWVACIFNPFRTSSIIIKLLYRNFPEKLFAFVVNIQQEQKLISSLDVVLAYVWKDFIELICLRNVTNA